MAKWPSRNSEFSHETWWIFPVRSSIVYQRVAHGISPVDDHGLKQTSSIDRIRLVKSLLNPVDGG